MRSLPYILGFIAAAIFGSSMGLTAALLAWQPKAMFEWGMIVMALGVAYKTIFDRL